MFRTIRTFVLVAASLGLAAPAFAKDPLEMPFGPRPIMPRNNAAVKPLITLEGREEWGTNGSLVFKLYQAGRAVMIDETRRPIEGTYHFDGDRVQLFFGNCVYDATDFNGILVGRARYTTGPNAGTGWNFRVTVGNVLSGRTFAGNETLPGYGAVTFRFINGNTVEMIDRDGATRGTYRQHGLQVTMTFGSTSYIGDIRGNAIAGSANNTQSNWTFRVSAHQ